MTCLSLDPSSLSRLRLCQPLQAVLTEPCVCRLLEGERSQWEASYVSSSLSNSGALLTVSFVFPLLQPQRWWPLCFQHLLGKETPGFQKHCLIFLWVAVASWDGWFISYLIILWSAVETVSSPMKPIPCIKWSLYWKGQMVWLLWLDTDWQGVKHRSLFSGFVSFGQASMGIVFLGSYPKGERWLVWSVTLWGGKGDT